MAITLVIVMTLSLMSTAPMNEMNEGPLKQGASGDGGGDDPSVTLTRPVGGEEYNVGEVFDILFSNSDLSGDIILELTTDGSAFSPIATKAVSPSTSSWHEWTVPDSPTTTAQIRISSVDDPTITDISNYFTIIGESEVERDYECEDFNGFAGPVWASGTVYYIGNIVEHPAGSGEFWMVETSETVNLPLDADWEGPCSCRDIWNGTKDTWESTSTYSHYKIVYHDRTYYYANDDTPAGKIPGGIDWWIACGDAHACDNLQGQVSQFWSPSIAGPSPQVGPGYSKGDVVTIQTTSGLAPNVWVSNVDQNHAYPTESKTNWQTGWDLTTVDSSHLVGYWPGIDLDSNDNIHISYFDDVNDHLKYATFDGTSWITSVIDSSGDGGHHSSLVVDSNDHIHVAYAANVVNELRYAVYDGNSWALSVVGPARADSFDSSTSITVDANNNPHISYFDKITPYSLMYSAFDGTTWTTHTVDNTAQHNGVLSEIAVDSAGGVHISYTGPITTSNAWFLKYAHYDGGSWSKTMIGPGIYSSIAIDSNDNPRIAYGKQNGYGMGEYRLQSGSWYNSYVYQGGIHGGQHVALVIDDDDVSHIASRRSTPSLSTGYALVYSTDISGGWETDIVDTQSGPIRYSDIALDSQGYPHIAYTKWGSSRSLGHAGPSLTEGNNWTKCNCSDLAEPWVADNGEMNYYDALSVVSHNGNYWMSISDNNRLEPGTYPSDWVLCVDGNPCENKSAGEHWIGANVYGLDSVVEYPINSGKYWVSLQPDNPVEPSDTATQWWWPCSCEDLASGSWQTENEYQQWQVVEWEGTYWIALVDHSSTAADSPDIPGGVDYWKPCEVEFCTSTGWWDSGWAVSGLYDTGVVVSHPYPNDDRWISMIDNNQWLPIVNGEFWLRCNSDDPIIDDVTGEPTDPPVGVVDGDSDGGDSTSPLPGFTGIMTMVAMLSAIIISKRRDNS